MSVVVGVHKILNEEKKIHSSCEIEDFKRFPRNSSLPSCACYSDRIFTGCVSDTGRRLPLELHPINSLYQGQQGDAKSICDYREGVPNGVVDESRPY